MAKKDKDFGNDELQAYYEKAYQALDNETNLFHNTVIRTSLYGLWIHRI